MTTDSPIRRLFARQAGVVMTVPELAELMRVAENTILKYIAEGRLAAVKLERGHRILTDDAVAFFETLYREATPATGEAATGDTVTRVAEVRQLRPRPPGADPA